MPKILIDGRTIEVIEGTTILKAAGQVGIQIPHLCYHPAFAPEGSCRLCLVEIEGAPKLELACATVVRDGMVVRTQSEKVIEARRSVLEFLLAEHPLDCPICDKAGECKLQDYYEAYGLFESRFNETKEKRDKLVRIGPNLILDRERCIQCTRCVRFLLEFTKTGELGVFERGIKSVIGFYEGEPVNNNYSGNLAELCPVGAITDLDFRFKTRTWFLERRPSICPLCSRGCNIYLEFHKGLARIDLKQRVYRIRSRENPYINSYWICDLGRYSYHDLDENRIAYPFQIIKGQKTKLSWGKIYLILVEKIKKLIIKKKTSRIVIVLTSALTNEEFFIIKKLFVEELKVNRIIFCDPPDENGDNLLLTAERVPNRRGALDMGFNLKIGEEVLNQDKIDLLIILASHLSNKMVLNWLNSMACNIETKFLLSCHESKLNELVDIVVPVTVSAEKEGSFTNIDGKIQKFEAALEPWRESRPEWKILVDLARNIPLNFHYFSRFNSVKAIREAMAEEKIYFREIHGD
ncbi:MAG: 2Fe-2S iron-sulfur cluster-binding protein [Candidatus Aminicenantes bacterium]|nr:2Fe-2S iron-sulfur cluster-binding protein [Candidatus Aminicenantes bacterium]